MINVRWTNKCIFLIFILVYVRLNIAESDINDLSDNDIKMLSPSQFPPVLKVIFLLFKILTCCKKNFR